MGHAKDSMFYAFLAFLLLYLAGALLYLGFQAVKKRLQNRKKDG